MLARNHVLADEGDAVAAQQRIRLDQLYDLADRQPLGYRIIDAAAVERMRAGGNAQTQFSGVEKEAALRRPKTMPLNERTRSFNSAPERGYDCPLAMSRCRQNDRIRRLTAWSSR